MGVLKKLQKDAVVKGNRKFSVIEEDKKVIIKISIRSTIKFSILKNLNKKPCFAGCIRANIQGEANSKHIFAISKS